MTNLLRNKLSIYINGREYNYFFMVVNEKCLNDFFMFYIVMFMYIAASKVNGNFHN